MKSKHTHKYIRSKLGEKVIYKCILPDCTHYLFADFILNKKSVCHRCDEVFFIYKRLIWKKVKKLYCKDCGTKKVSSGVQDFLATLGVE